MPIVNDVTCLNPIEVQRIVTPCTVAEIQAAVRDSDGPISVGGARCSMGGQTAVDGGIFLDMRRFNQVLALDVAAKTVTVQSGITWRELQRHIDAYDLAVKVMQSYCNFTIGGSLSVNCHGRYVGLGPLILSVREIRLVLADGSLVAASPSERPELFYGAIGGYGGLGVIVEATLELTDNRAIEKESVLLPLRHYRSYFREHVEGNHAAVFHNADLYPPYRFARVVTWFETDAPVTVPHRYVPEGQNYWLSRLMVYLITERPWRVFYRELIDRRAHRGHQVVWRNYEASYDVQELEPTSRDRSTFVLQEYFVAPPHLEAFARRMIEILRRYHVKVLNVSIRHARPDPGSMLAWARDEVFAFVLYYKQETHPAARAEVGVWTRELIDAVLEVEGTWYLPYQIHGTAQQFARAYPRAAEYFALKAQVDPQHRFRNRLWEAYHPDLRSTPRVPDRTSRFHTVYDQTVWRDAFFRFLQNIFHLYPEAPFHHLITEAVANHATDEDVYRAIQKALPAMAPSLGAVRYALPALLKQKDEMARQTALLMNPCLSPVRGYVEYGTAGRYVKPLQKVLPISGPIYVISDTKPTRSLSDVFERGQIGEVGTWQENHYDPIELPEESVDLVTVYIGLHHCPLEKLDAFVASLARVLRPGGSLMVRDHEVDGPDIDALVHLAHDVYNAGLGVPWEKNREELRYFTSLAEVQARLARHGLVQNGPALLQKNDPTRNSLMRFVKTRGGTPAAALEAQRRGQRGAELTFLTLPEWYIVFSAREVAQRPQRFPYLEAVRQYWQAYAFATRNAAFNAGYIFMLWVIGFSFTVEYVGKGLYEATIGRLTEAPSAENDFAARVAQEYARWLDLTPWFDFPYVERLRELWRLPAPKTLRSIERRYALTFEYALKALYAGVIRPLTGMLYGKVDERTLVRVDRLPALDDPRIELIGDFDQDTQLISLPRYQPTTEVLVELAQRGIRAYEIAGNDTVLVTVLADGSVPAARLVIPVLSQAGRCRVVLHMPIRDLPELVARGVEVEHVFDL